LPDFHQASGEGLARDYAVTYASGSPTVSGTSTESALKMIFDGNSS
jgi:hypothetical protein